MREIGKPALRARRTPGSRHDEDEDSRSDHCDDISDAATRLGHGLRMAQVLTNPPSARPPTAAIDTTRHGEHSLEVHDQAFVHEVLTPKDTIAMKTKSDAASAPTIGITRRSWTCGTSASCPLRVLDASTIVSEEQRARDRQFGHQ